MLKLAGELLVGAIILVLVLAAAALWRLAQGAIDITNLARRHLPPGATLAHAEIAWEGFVAAGRPIDVRLTALRLPGIEVPHARVTLSLLAAIRGELAPRSIDVEGLNLSLVRDANGAITLAGAAPGGGTSAAPPLQSLASIRLTNARLTIHDEALAMDWQASVPEASLHRAGAALAGHAAATLTAGGAYATIDATATEAEDGGTAIAAHLSPVDPPLLADILPSLHGLAMVQAPVSGEATLHLGATFRPGALALTLHAGAGRILAGTGAVPVSDGEARIEATPSEAHLTALRIQLAAPAGARAPAPTLTGTAHGRRDGHQIVITFALDIGTTAFADLAAYWPAGTGGGGRPWVIQNITTGTARDAHVEGTVQADDSFVHVTVPRLTGQVIGENLTAWWLRPMPPITNARARLVIDSADVIRVLVSEGRQGRLKIESGTVKISGLTAKDQPGDITARISGPLPDALALLGHPRLNLLHKLPIPTEGAAGTMKTQLTLSLPLDDRVTMDEIAIAADATLAGVRLADVAAGRSLENGALQLHVDTEKLALSGTGQVAGIPGKFKLAVDFRAGKPTDVIERATAEGQAPADALARAGAGAIVQGGAVGYRVSYQNRRDKTGTVDIAADLTGAVLGSPAGWSKPAGAPAQAQAMLALAGGKLASVPKLQADGPGLALRGRMSTAGAARTLVLDRIMLGRTDVHGSVAFPAGRSPLRIAVAGPALDVSPFLKQKGSEPGADDGSPGQAWDASIGVRTLIVGKTERISPLSLTAASDGRRIVRARLEGAAGGLHAAITPAAGGRRLSITSNDAGQVLRDTGVTDSVRGGKLRVEGAYADSAPHTPLSGTATLDQFRVLDAPAAGRLLKAITLYGAIDLLRGPGLGFQRAIVPFRWQQQILTMKDARAYSASLGITVKGDVDLSTHTAQVAGTVVPAYFFNQLLGKIPLIGRIFSPEKGGGVFAARYTVKGPLADPKVQVNALSALTPGILRNLFGPG